MAGELLRGMAISILICCILSIHIWEPTLAGHTNKTETTKEKNKPSCLFQKNGEYLVIFDRKSACQTKCYLKRKFFKRRILYYNNTRATYNHDFWLLLSGGCPNPGPREGTTAIKIKCVVCERTIGKNIKRPLECSVCT